MGTITYNIKYKVCLSDGTVLVNKEINVKNCDAEIQAKIKLEEYLKHKYPNFQSLVIYECKQDYMSAFNDMFKGGSNPFGGSPDLFGDMFGKKK